MPQQTAKEEAVRRALARLAGVEMAPRLTALGLPAEVDGVVTLRAFGQEVALRLADFAMTNVRTGKPAGMTDQILILHYLLCEVPLGTGTDAEAVARGALQTTELITYRDFAGGQFYLSPFLARTAKPLVARIGNDVEKLKHNLARFDWQPIPVPPGDFAARVHALGNLHVTLVYTLDDDEFPASCEILFDTATKRVYGAEDAAVLASRVCLGLL